MSRDSALITLYTKQYHERKIAFMDIPEKYRDAVYERLNDFDKARADEERS